MSLRTVEIANNTNAQAFYQFVTEPTGCFEFSRTDGTVIPESSVNVDIRFKARIPGNFYRRIFVLVKNQGPLYLDLTATAYHQNQDQVPRPLPLFQKHVDNYWRRQLQEGTEHALAVNDSENMSDPVAAIWNEFFLDDTDRRRQICVQEGLVEFGAASGVGLGEYKTVTIINNTSVKQTAVFMVPPDNYVEQSEDAGEIRMTTLGPVLQPMLTCFKVFPEKGDVLPHSQTAFKVAFRPEYNNAYYAQSLEVFVYPKTQRNFRLVNDDNFVPPHCVRPVCSGNTFPANMESFTPKLRVPTTRINFPACPVSDKAYQVVEMYNDADTPLRFQIEEDAVGIFRCKPSNGLIMPHCAQLVAFMFCPSEARRYETVVTCTMNGSAKHAVKFTLVGKGNAVSLNLETKHLQIKPTCTGSVTTRTLQIHNPTGVPMHYHWKVPDGYQRVLAVEPEAGILRGNERHTLHWHFAPKREGAYAIKVPVSIERAHVKTLGDKHLEEANFELSQTMNSVEHAAGRSMRSKRQQKMYLNVYGTGSGGGVLFEPEIIDFGTLVVGSEVTRVIKLINRSEVTMYHDMLSSMPNNLSYKDGKGYLAAHSTKRVTICFTPESRMYYNVTISCKLTTGSEAMETKVPGTNAGSQLLLLDELDQLPQCNVLGNAVYPTLSVLDVRCEGVSSSRLWRELSFIRMNAELSSDLSSTEILWNRAEIDETDPCKVLQVTEMRFKAKEVGSSPSVCIVRVKNTGVLALDFLLKYPRDDEDEPENWVDKDLQGIEELTLNMILENKLFVCEPRKGHLEIGEEVDLVLSYKHVIPTGEFRLPVILNVCELPPAGGIVNTGKQIVLCLMGQTLQPFEPYLHIPVADPRYYKHCEWGFERTPIGLMTPPIQYYTLANHGTSQLQYHLDLTEVEALNAASFGFDVVTCLDNTDGELDPGDEVTLRWVFNPLEAKMHTWTVPISVVGGDMRVIKFYAEGYHPDPHSTPEGTVWPLPLAQLMPIPNQPVMMSWERLVLRDIPMGAAIQRLVVLTNTNKDDVMLFSFDLSGELAAQFLTVTPAEGAIPPETHVVVRVTVRCMTTSVFDFDVPCVIQPKPPPEEENEDLADDKDAAPPDTMAKGRPLTGATSVTAATTAAGGSKTARRRKRQSVIDQPPPMRGGTRRDKSATHRGSVSFLEQSAVTAGEEGGGGVKGHRGSVVGDDAISVKSGASRVSQGTVAAPGGMSKAGTGATSGTASPSAPAQEEVPALDYSLFLSVQANVRMPALHRSLFDNDDLFWFPKGSMLHGELSPPEAKDSSSSTNKDGHASNSRAQSAHTIPNLPAGGGPGGAGGSRPSTQEGSRLRAEVTEGVLEQLLNDVLADEQVLAAFDELEEMPTPCYVQLVKDPPPHFRSSQRTEPAGEGGDEGEGEEQVCAGVDVPGHAAFVDAEAEAKDIREIRRREEVLRLPEFANLAAFVVDACVFNMLEEATFGEEVVS